MLILHSIYAALINSVELIYCIEYIEILALLFFEFCLVSLQLSRETKGGDVAAKVVVYQHANKEVINKVFVSENLVGYLVSINKLNF